MKYSQLYKVVTEVLENKNEIKENQDLMELGLNSIKIMRIINKLMKEGVKLRFSELIQKPSLKEWYKLCSKDSGENIVNRSRLNDCLDTTPNNKFNLTQVQYAYMVGREDDQVLGGISCHAYLEFYGKNIDLDRLKKAWSVLLYHHPMLRAKFNDDKTQEVMENPYSLDIQVNDYSRYDKDYINRKLKLVREKISHRKMDIRNGQVIGLEISMLPQNKYIIHFDLELLVADVTSLQIIFRDLNLAYCEKQLDKESKNWNFGEYIVLTSEKNKVKRDADKKYWNDRLVDFPLTPPIPIARNPREIKKTRFNRRILRFNNKEREDFKQFAKINNCTEAMLLLTAYAMTIERWNEESHFLINIPLFNRDTEFKGIDNAVGDFTSLLLLEINAKEINGFYDMLRLIKSQFYKDMEHTSYTGVEVERDLSRKAGEQCNIAPLVFACNLGMKLIDKDFEKNLGKLSYMISQTPQIWLDFQSYEDNDGLMLTWDTIDELFYDGTIDTMFDVFKKTLTWMIDEAENTNKDEIRDLFKRSINKELYIKDEINKKNLCDIFLDTAQRYPKNIALIDSLTGEKYNYSKLRSLSMIVANNILKYVKVKQSPIAISLEKGAFQIISVLGVLLSGNYYVPIGIDQPLERRKSIQDKIGINYIISRNRYYMKWKDNSIIFDIEKLMVGEKVQELPYISPEDTAYIIMTSGSTGEPKGVEIAHYSALNTIQDINKKFNINSSDRILSLSALDFDLSVYDIFSVLHQGGAVVTIPSEENKNAAYWLEKVEEYKITIWNSVPILFDMFVVTALALEKHNLPLRLVLLSGDWINLDTPKQAIKISENCRVVSLGGATEGSIWSNYYEVKLPIPKGWKSIPYGKALENQEYRIVDSKGRDCPDYVNGELWIGGYGVAKGYKGDLLLTKEKFKNINGIRWYKTGDMGRFWNDGNIEFLGRRDSQVKIRGHRIEIGEIEVAINNISFIKDSVVVVPERSFRKKYLAAFIIVKDKKINEVLIKDKIINILNDKIPHYMIPMTYYILNEFPLNKNGKVDRKELCKIASERESGKNDEKLISNFEKEILNIWNEVFNTYHLDIDDNYFRLGGDSLTATQIIALIKRNIGVEVSIGELFSNPTVRRLASVIKYKNVDYSLPIIKTNILTNQVPVTDIQYAYWIGRKKIFALGSVSSHTYYEIDNKQLDILKLEKAFNILIKQHEMLRTIISEDGMNQNIIDNTEYYKFIVYDFSDENAENLKSHISKVRSEMEAQVLDVSKWPIFDIRISIINKEKTIVHISFDNIVLDAGSIMKLLYEWTCLYNDIDNFRPKKLELNFRDYALYLKQLENYPIYLKSKDYWMNRLDSFPALLKPKVIKNSDKVINQKFIRLQKVINEETWKKIKEIAGIYSLTPSMVLLTLYVQNLSDNNYQNHFSVVLTMLNRLQVNEDINDVLGDFTSTILFEVNLSDKKSFLDNANQIQEQFMKDSQYYYYSGIKFQRELHKRNKSIWKNEMPIVFTSTLGLDNKANNLFGDIKYHITQTPQVWLDYQIQEVDGELICNWDYVEEMFDSNDIRNQFDRYIESINSLSDESKWMENKNIDYMEGTI